MTKGDLVVVNGSVSGIRFNNALGTIAYSGHIRVLCEEREEFTYDGPGYTIVITMNEHTIDRYNRYPVNHSISWMIPAKYVAPAYVTSQEKLE